jgi:two-component system, chemotaxis family, CheB/CheR fusion protein
MDQDEWQEKAVGPAPEFPEEEQIQASKSARKQAGRRDSGQHASLDRRVAGDDAELQRAADRIVLANFGPPGLIIDERMNVLQARGSISQFLDITPGRVSWNLLRVVRDSIANQVRKAAQRAIHDNVPATETAVVIDDQGGQHVKIDVLPLASGSARPRSFLVLFQSQSQESAAKTVEKAAQPTLTVDEKDRLIAQLRHDLSSTRFHLQALVEERDARNQELVTANEEIQSANEVLQSTNEELETTKEELQSANEELRPSTMSCSNGTMSSLRRATTSPTCSAACIFRC